MQCGLSSSSIPSYSNIFVCSLELLRCHRYCHPNPNPRLRPAKSNIEPTCQYIYCMVRMSLPVGKRPSGIMKNHVCPAFSLVVDLVVGLNRAQGPTEVSAHFELDFVSWVPILLSGSEYFTPTDHAVSHHRAFKFSGARGMIVLSLVVQTCQTEASFLLSRLFRQARTLKTNQPNQAQFHTATGSGTTIHCA